MKILEEHIPETNEFIGEANSKKLRNFSCGDIIKIWIFDQNFFKKSEQGTLINDRERERIPTKCKNM